MIHGGDEMHELSTIRRQMIYRETDGQVSFSREKGRDVRSLIETSIVGLSK